MSATTGVHGPDLPPAEAAGPERVGAWSGPPAWLVGAVVAAGVVLRLIVLLGPLGRPDSDEVIAGLIARHLGSDGLPAFFWGQHYGGTIEALPVAASLRLFGTSVAALRAPTLLLGVVNAVLVWRCGRRVTSEGRARVAGLLAWVWPPAVVWYGAREMLFYAPTVTFGLTAVLLALRLGAVDRDGATGRWRIAEWAGLGVALGLGWWTSPNMSYFVVAAAVTLLLPPGRVGRVVVPPWRGVLVGGGAALVTALPWLWVNVQSPRLQSLRTAETFHQTGSYPDRVLWFFTHGLPAEMGFREIGTFDWVLGPLGLIAYLATATALAVVVVRVLRRGSGRWSPPFDVVGFLVFPLIMATIPFVKSQGNLRYLFFLAPFLCLLLARLVDSRRVAVAVLAAAVLVTGLGLWRVQVVSEAAGAPHLVGVVDSLDEVERVLDREGIDAVHADYWIAYRLAFETDERIVASPSAGALRYLPYEDRVRHADRTAWIVASGSVQEQAMRQRLDDLGVGFRVVPAGDLSVVITDRNVQPEELPNEARTPDGWEMAPAPGETY
ncbi:MAG: glycosyltransferase family 39 protein [Acidimicrobiales bacterium]